MVFSGCDNSDVSKQQSDSVTSSETDTAAFVKEFSSLGISPVPELKPPTDVALLDMKGNYVRLSDFKGKIVFLNFWATWCPQCVVEMPDMEKLYKGLKDKDFIMLAVDVKESHSTVKKFMDKKKFTFNVLLDEKGKMGDAFGVRAIPTTYILNKQGLLIGRAMGSRDWNNRASNTLFRALIETE